MASLPSPRAAQNTVWVTPLCPTKRAPRLNAAVLCPSGLCPTLKFCRLPLFLPGNRTAPPRALRRTFTQQYKDSILTQAAQCTQPGQIGSLLRREGLYSSHLVDWRRQQERQQAKRVGQAPPPIALAVQNKALRAKTKQLEKQLTQAQALLDLQKKVSQLLGITLETLDNSEENS